MLRVLIAGVLAVSGAAACSKTDAPAVAADKPAGKVVELSGEVTATRGGKTRPLAVGAEVFADDEIATNESTVTIELFHNNATWAVASNKQARVDASLAWGLDKQAATKPVDHNSAAAGRNAERSAADTASSAPAAAADESAPIVQPRAAESAPMREKADDGVSGGAPMPPPPPKIKAPAPGSVGKGAPTAKDAPKPAPRARNLETVDGVFDREASTQTASPLYLKLKAKHAALTKCLAQEAPQVTLTVTVKDGKASIQLGGSGNITDKVRACMDIVVQKIQFDGDGTVKIEFR